MYHLLSFSNMHTQLYPMYIITLFVLYTFSLYGIEKQFKPIQQVLFSLQRDGNIEPESVTWTRCNSDSNVCCHRKMVGIGYKHTSQGSIFRMNT